MEAVPPRSFPREKGTPVSTVPIQPEGPRPFFPAVCLKTHWDPTMILRHTLPEGNVALPTDPRPWTRICMEYTTAGTNEPAPAIDPSIALPSGGQFYPHSRYAEAIDNESQLRRLDRILGTCEVNQYETSVTSDMFMAQKLLPPRKPMDSRFISELANPQVLLRNGPYPCREDADMRNLSRSSLLFNNATKQDRYKQSFTTKKMM